MKKIIYTLLVFVCSLYSFGQTNTENYIETTAYRSEYLGPLGDFNDYSHTLTASDLVSGGNGTGGGSITIQDNVLRINFNASWPSTSALKSGVVATLNTTPALPDLELGDVMTSNGPSGYKMKIEGGELVFYSRYFITSVNTTMTRLIPNTSEYYNLNYNTNLGSPFTCTSGGGGGSSSLRIESGYVYLTVAGSWSPTCQLKTGNIRYLTTNTLPDMELGTFYHTNDPTNPSIYKAKIENNYLIYYASEALPPYPTSISDSETLILNKNDDLANRTIAYYDGLGRPKQNVVVKAGGQKQDIITHFEYDTYGRQEKENLPYASTSSNNGSIRTSPLAELQSFYNTPKYENTTNPFSQVQFEASPLNRTLKQAAPGISWKMGNGHEIESDYKTNVANEVRRLEAIFANDDPLTPELVANTSSYYAAGELQKSVVKDENHPGTTTKNHTTEEFTNIEGNVVLKRTYADTDIDGDNIPESQVPHDTYYVYDKYGNLAYVVPPKVDLSDGVSTDELNELCYQYIYDGRNRLIEKKIPGKDDKEYIVYNKRNEPIMTQDGNLKAQNKWLFTLYDAYGRVAYTGIDNGNSKSRAQLQTEADAVSNQYVTKTDAGNTYAGTTVFYTKNAYPTSFDEVYTINYYDNYAFDTVGLTSPATVFGESVSNDTQSLPTGSKVKVLETNDWITTVTYYDQKARSIYMATKNEYLGTTDQISSQLDFVGNVIKTRARHQKGSNTAIVTVDAFTYDHQNRLISQKQCIGDDSLSNNCGQADPSLEANIVLSEEISGTTNTLAGNSITLLPGFHAVASVSTSYSAKIQETSGELIVANTYDELGRMTSKKVGNTESQPLQQVDYAYTIRGWMKSINNGTTANGDLFGFAIDYDSGANALYNGNIAKTSWRTANDHVTRNYTYTYDALNRILGATSTSGNYDVFGIAYDRLGNITNLSRKGHVNNAATSFGNMDILSYTYNSGNQLLEVTDTGNDSYGFKDGSNTNDDYEYDTNGNMTIDRNKGINNIIYNHLNLPTLVTIANSEHNGNISYIYDATGSKVKKITTEGGSVTNTEYAGNFIYENNQLQFFSTSEGYVTTDNNSYQYVYQFVDHLGNIRLSYNDDDRDGIITGNEIVEESNYYPFGLQQMGYNGVINGTENNYKTFQGQEEEKELSKNTYAYQWRDYDPTLARFSKIDRFAEKYYSVTPYHFSAGNPLFFKEINGDSIQGVSRKSARRAKRIIRKTFRKNKKLAKLFRIKGKNFRGISQNDFDNATQNSSNDERALAKGYFKAINSKEKHTVEIVKRGEKLRSSLSQREGHNRGRDVEPDFGAGFNFGRNGSHSVVIMNSKRNVLDTRDNVDGSYVLNRTASAGETLAHEIIGHGLTHFNYGGNQFVNAIQVSNLYLRVKNGNSRIYRDGSEHGNSTGTSVVIPGTISWQIPLFLK